MAATAEDVFKLTSDLTEKYNLKNYVESVEHRPDYGDYRVTLIPPEFNTEDELSLEGKYYTDLREGLINILMENPKHGDSVREAIFKLKHALEYTEFD